MIKRYTNLLYFTFLSCDSITEKTSMSENMFHAIRLYAVPSRFHLRFVSGIGVDLTGILGGRMADLVLL